jgi:hypothetical protein
MLGVIQSPYGSSVSFLSFFSFLVKVGERWILGTWDLPYFFFIKGNITYIIGWSLLDGLYPCISMVGLR